MLEDFEENFYFWSSFEELNEYNELMIPIIQTNQIEKINEKKVNIIIKKNIVS